MTNEAVVQTRNLSKVYRDFWGRKKVQAVKSLSLDVHRGEVFGLLGPNGSGKTTTVKMLLGLLFPTDGEIKILGQSPTDVEKNERIGYLPEESYLYKFLNAEETLDFYGKLFNMPKKERRDRARQLIVDVGLEHARKRQLREYSKGMTRRIGLAQALINDPELVILDEPTSGFDPMGRDDMKTLIGRLKDQGKTVVMCSHLLGDVQEICDRIAILYGGELKVMGSVDELLQAKEQTQFTTPTLDDATIAEVREVLERHGVDIERVDRPQNTLEDLFLRTVKESRERPGRRHVPGETPDAPASPSTKPDEPEPAAANN